MVRQRWQRRIDLPYAALNLRYNPFGELTRGQRLETAVPRCDLDSILEFLVPERRAVQFMGPAGSGKSTHLFCLADGLPKFCYVHLPEAKKREVPAREDLMIDEAQRLRRRPRMRLWRSARRIVLGTHVDLDRSLTSCGFSVRTIRLDQQPTATWLQQTVNQKLMVARRTEAPLASMNDATAVKLLREFGNNVRAIDRYLYERFQQFEERAADGQSLDMQALFTDEIASS
ncbi:MAG: hypothetical protein ACR2NP_06445 [Pirellulaceae bacterium]